MEDGSALNAMVHHIFDEVLKTTKLDHEIVTKKFLNAWEEASAPQLDLELETIFQEMPEEIPLARLTILKELQAVQDSANPQPRKIAEMMKDLEIESFQILKSQIEHDVKAQRVFLNKMSTFDSGVYWQKQAWMSEKYQECQDAVEAYIKTRSKLVLVETFDAAMREYLDWKDYIIKKPLLQLDTNSMAAQYITLQ